MSQQAEDDWWNRLYDESTPDTGPTTRTGDTLDTRFDSASDAVTPSVPDPRTVPLSGPGSTPQRQQREPQPMNEEVAAPSRAESRTESQGEPEVRPQPTAPRSVDGGTDSERSAAHPGRPTGEPPSDAAPSNAAAPPDGPPTATPGPASTASARDVVSIDAFTDNDTPRGPAPTAPPVRTGRFEAVDPPERPVVPPATAQTPAGAPVHRPQPQPPQPAPPITPRPRAPWEPPVPEDSAAPPVTPPAPVTPPRPPGRPAGEVPQRPTVPPAFARPPGPRTTGPDRPRGGYVGDRPPTYDPEPTALPAATPEGLGHSPSDTVLDGARYGSFILRAASVRGDSARYRGEPRRDALLTVRFGNGTAALVLVVIASGARSAGPEMAHRAAADACHWIGGAVGRSHARLSEDIRAGRRGDLKSGLHRLTDRSLGKLRTSAVEAGVEPQEYRAGLRALLLSADPACRTRVYFGVGAGGLLRLRGGVWQDIEPSLPSPQSTVGEPVLGYGSARPQPSGPDDGPGRSPDPQPTAPEGDRLTMDLGIPAPPSPYVEVPTPGPAEPFRFRASVAQPGDTLLLCSPGFAEPLRSETALTDELANRWTATAEPPGLAAFLADVQLRATGYADDRTAAAIWET
ncbi:protein phosphatase 2C domain-containing protein [Streptomyces sp. NPDC005953]|uniref:protein phosphatase 2C domain-containing protein n=1 Tax=Streptomyces sp. NPDC005953 TaxID=3156719 RepID=UPI0033DCED9A